MMSLDEDINFQLAMKRKPIFEAARRKAAFLLCGNHTPFISDDVYYYITHTLDIGGEIAAVVLNESNKLKPEVK